MFEYGTRLKSLRISKNKTQAEFAQLLEMKQPNYQRLEKGELDIKISMLISICSSLNVSADWLLGLSNEMNPSRLNAKDLEILRARGIAARRAPRTKFGGK